MKRLISLVAALLLVTTALAMASGQGADTVTISREEYERLKQYDKLDEVKHYVDRYFYEEPDQQKLMDGAIQGMMGGTGDSYTFYYPEEAWKTLWEEDEGKYAGIGVQMLGSHEDGSVTIIRVFKNTPAEEAGLRRGDVFYKVEDIEVTTSTMQDAVNTMRGKPGEQVHVEVVRGSEMLEFDIIKAEITVNRVESKMLENQVGYIALYEFAGESYNDFHNAYQELKKQDMRSLIIDLRDNGGGWVTDGVRVADLFLEKELLFYTENREGKQEMTYTTRGSDDIPLTLLVNENSASTTEILSAALKEHGRARIVGTQTFGKGIIQLVVGLSDGTTGIQFTSSQYFTPNGNKVHKVGVEPDIIVEMPEEQAGRYFTVGDLDDPQLKAAYDEALSAR